MSDLKRDLRRYVDGLEEPVSIQEAMERGTRRRRFQVPAAVLAGAAVVLIPALVLIGLRLLPGDEGDVSDTTVPPTTVTTTTLSSEPTVTTVAPSSLITVPDLVGLSTSEAQDLLEALGLQLVVVEERYSPDATGIAAQSPDASTSVATGTTVLVDVYLQAVCRTYALDLAEGFTTVNVLTQCPPGSVPDFSHPLPRAVPEGGDPIEATLEALLAGPTDEERSWGIDSSFSSETASALESTEINGNRLTVDFNDAILVNNASTYTGSVFFLAELQANLFQFPEVAEIEFRLNGSCDAFFGWLQSDCQIVTRADWEATVAAWEAERDAEVATTRSIEQRDLDIADSLAAFAQGDIQLGDLPIADEVVLGLNTVEQVTVTGSDLESPSGWVIPLDDFGGIEGPFDVLGPLRSEPVSTQINLGPRTHCAGSPLEFGSPWSEGRHLVIEPAATESCLQWFAIHVLLNANSEIQAVTLDLWEP